MRNDLRGNFRELINFPWKNFDVQSVGQPVTEFVAVTDQGHSKAETGERSKNSDHCALPQKNPNDLRNTRTERFHDADLATFLNCDGDKRAHDAEGGHDDWGPAAGRGSRAAA